MAGAIEESFVVIPFLTPQYQESTNCKLELNYAHNQNKLTVPVMVEPNWQPKRWLGFLVNSKLYVDFRPHVKYDDSISLLIEQLKRANENIAKLMPSESKSTTKMSNSIDPKRSVTKKQYSKLAMGVLENTFITHTFLLKESTTGNVVALFQTNRDTKLVGTFKKIQLYVDYVEHSGEKKPGLKWLSKQDDGKAKPSSAMIINDPVRVVQSLTDKTVKSQFYQGDKGYTLEIKNVTNMMLDAYWVNYEGGMRLLGRHSIPACEDSSLASTG